MAEDTAAAAPSSPAAMDGIPEDLTGSEFQCCVCLDLLYKPVVLSCGHISCFWCVHKAMHSLRTSHCAICRQPYKHFPNICQLLHNLLLKIAPVSYKRREKEVLEEERHSNIYSPQLLDDLNSAKVHSEVIEKSAENLKDNRNIASQKTNLAENGLVGEICKQVSVDDVLCSLCKELLFQPAVLNCGHVFCGSCLSVVTGRPVECQVCQCVHPGEFPNICLDLDHFLEEQFPREYTARREKELLVKFDRQEKDSSSSSLKTEEENAESSSHAKDKAGEWLDEDLSNAHYGVGCDSCGLYPLMGKRYRCQDCKELVGFDLCEACYNTSSKLPGRFNQQHTPAHKFELDDSMLLRKILRFSPLPAEDPHEEFLEEYVADDHPEGHE